MSSSYPKDSFSKKDRSDFPGCLTQNPTFHPIHLNCFARSVGDGSSVSWSTPTPYPHPTPAGFGEKSLRPRISRKKVTILQKSREETRQMERGGYSGYPWPSSIPRGGLVSSGGNQGSPTGIPALSPFAGSGPTYLTGKLLDDKNNNTPRVFLGIHEVIAFLFLRHGSLFPPQGPCSCCPTSLLCDYFLFSI